MTYKEFLNWCNERACDGMWGMQTAEICIAIIGVMKSTPFWKRKQKWRLMEDEIVRLIVNPTNEKIREFLEKEGEDT